VNKEFISIVQPRSMFNEARWQELDEALRGLPNQGCMVEIGCHQGGTLAYLAMLEPKRLCYGFDTFDAGVVGSCPEDGEPLRDGIMATSYSDTYDWLTHKLGCTNTILVKGDVRELLPLWNAPPIAFVLIDLNIYSPTLIALEWVSDHCAETTVILVDDVGFPGVDQALADSKVNWDKVGYMARVWL
jgi:hypothetical protein